ncbi:nucleotidyltransferase domain-containing protein [Halosimplex aquaticum]|uniref:Nucleotidyltransferase domain-containing protein n=1 Tax=Halosimplex aquaticum TaxID=3026162 RepID=A0ABD5XY13_9EURY|nr:nucleotidyltransferase domain-containing protein [Halosimplex aquaticum]
MSEPDASTPLSGDTAHADAAEAFVERARSRFGERIEELYLFGSTGRGDAHGLASDVDVLVVLDDSDRESTADGLRELAYDVMLEYGPVVELHILSAETFERYQREGNPFIENVVSEGRSYA